LTDCCDTDRKCCKTNYQNRLAQLTTVQGPQQAKAISSSNYKKVFLLESGQAAHTRGTLFNVTPNHSNETKLLRGQEGKNFCPVLKPLYKFKGMTEWSVLLSDHQFIPKNTVYFV